MPTPLNDYPVFVYAGAAAAPLAYGALVRATGAQQRPMNAWLLIGGLAASAAAAHYFSSRVGGEQSRAFLEGAAIGAGSTAILGTFALLTT